jgi:hypothetical protein
MTEYTSGMDGCRDHGCDKPIFAVVTLSGPSGAMGCPRLHLCLEHLTDLRFDVKLKDGKPAGVGWGWAMV